MERPTFSSPSGDTTHEAPGLIRPFRVLLAVQCEITRWVLDGLLARLVSAECRHADRALLVNELGRGAVAGGDLGGHWQLLLADRELWLEVKAHVGVIADPPPLILVGRDVPNRSNLPTASLQTPVDVDVAARTLAETLARLRWLNGVPPGAGSPARHCPSTAGTADDLGQRPPMRRGRLGPAG